MISPYNQSCQALSAALSTGGVGSAGMALRKKQAEIPTKLLEK